MSPPTRAILFPLELGSHLASATMEPARLKPAYDAAARAAVVADDHNNNNRNNHNNNGLAAVEIGRWRPPFFVARGIELLKNDVI